MGRLTALLVLAWLGSGVIGFVVCWLIMFPPSRVARRVMVTLFGVSVVAAVLTVTALPLGGMELYRYLTHRVLASVGELRTGMAVMGRLAGALAGAAGQADVAGGPSAGARPVQDGSLAGTPRAAVLPSASERSLLNSAETPSRGSADTRAQLPSENDRRERRGVVPSSFLNDLAKREALPSAHRRRNRDRGEPAEPMLRNDKAERADRADRADKTDQLDKIGVADAVSDTLERGEKPRRTELYRADKGEKLDKSEKVEKAEKAEKSDKADKIEKVEKADKTDKVETAEKAEKSDKADKIETVEKTDKVENVDKIEKVEKTDNVERADRIARADRVEKVARVEKADKIERPVRIDKPTRPERIERPERRPR
jgi:hypothetical protein